MDKAFKKSKLLISLFLVLSLALFFLACGNSDNSSDPAGDNKPTTYTVTFNSQGGSAVGQKNNVEKDSKISEPTAPTKSGYTFEGWYKESACINLWNFKVNTVTSNITLYAKWKEEIVEHTVTFVSSNSGSSSWTEKIKDGELLKNSQLDPKTLDYFKNLYLFRGWFTDENCMDKFDTAMPITKDITLYGAYIAKNDAIIEYANYWMDYYEHEVNDNFTFYNTDMFKEWAYASMFTDLGMTISMSCVRQIYDVDNAGKDKFISKSATRWAQNLNGIQSRGMG